MPDWTEDDLRRMMREEIRRQGKVPELPKDPADFDIPHFLHGAGWTSRNLRFGVGTVTWAAAGSKSNVTTITHGMMIAPTSVVAVVIAVVGEGAGISCNVANVTATTFDIYGDYVNGFAPGVQNRTVHWVAIR